MAPGQSRKSTHHAARPAFSYDHQTLTHLNDAEGRSFCTALTALLKRATTYHPMLRTIRQKQRTSSACFSLSTRGSLTLGGTPLGLWARVRLS
eukprot:6208562-Pleurochrysis_carterae.AAC.1